MRQIISGEKNYVFRRSQDLAKQGYRIVKQKIWADGKYTLTVQKFWE